MNKKLMVKISKNKKFLKLVKEYIQIFSGCFEQIFYYAKIMPFAKSKSCSKRFEKIQTYSLSNSKNFWFLVISWVCSYFLPKNYECIDENFVIRAPFCCDQNEKLISEPHFLKIQAFIPSVKKFQFVDRPANLSKLAFKKKKKKKKDRKNRVFFNWFFLSL